MSSHQAPRPPLIQRIWAARISYLLLLPTLLLLGVFSYYPAFSGILYAFQEVEPGFDARWVGLSNFRRAFTDEVLLASIPNMIILLVGNVLRTTILPLIVAVMISHLSGARLRYFFQTSFLFPIVVPMMVIILLWRGFILDPNVGMLNQFLGLIGLEFLQQSWLGDHSTALGSVIFVGFPWIGGIGFLILYAGLLSIPASVMESARMDGVGPIRRFFTIELPLVLGQLRLVIVLTFIATIQDFGGMLVLTGGGPGTATHIPALHMYFYAFRFEQFGYAAAIGVLLFVLIFALTVLNLTLLKSKMED
ncbi:MAG: sugar ABC transporter permease [Candidatus Sumerlaeia bacterium]|nr:sugar ABC transporter permease [Candidatus Sumerlaeia bacterium]